MRSDGRLRVFPQDYSQVDEFVNNIVKTVRRTGFAKTADSIVMAWLSHSKNDLLIYRPIGHRDSP